MTKTDRTNAERQARWRERQQQKMLELERLKASASDQDEAETIRLKAENERLREALRSSTSELARLDDERDALRLELARLKQDAESGRDKPKRTRKKKLVC